MRRGFLEGVCIAAVAALLATMWAVLQWGQAGKTFNTEIARTSLDLHTTGIVLDNVALTQSAYYRKLGLDSTRVINMFRPLLDPTKPDSLPAVLRSLRGDATALEEMIRATNGSLNDPKVGLFPTSRTAVVAATGTLNATTRTGNAAAAFVEQATPPAVSTMKHADAISGDVNRVTTKYADKLTKDEKPTRWERVKSSFWVAVKTWYYLLK